MSSELVLPVITLLGIILSFVTARSTASSESLKALAEVVKTLRSERKADKEEFDAEKKILEQQLARRDAYIDLLIRTLNEHSIQVPPMPPISDGISLS